MADARGSYEFVGVPDGFQRLWTPHRMAYISGEAKPVDETEGACPFCAAPGASDSEGLIVKRGQLCFVVMNLFPYNSGHVLVCPYRHIPRFTQATLEERAEIAQLTVEAMRTLEKVGGAQGFNIGMNQGEVAGAGIAAHLHQHIVPRYLGDANFLPIIGQTKAVPRLIEEQRLMLQQAWE